MQNYNKKIPKLRISKVCKLARVKVYQLTSVKAFNGEKGKLLTCNMFTLKQCRNKICNMAHLFSTDTDKTYPEQLVNILGTGVAAAVTKTEGGKRG